MAVFAPSEPDDTRPSKEVIRHAHQSACEIVRTRAHGATVFMALHGKAVLDEGGVSRIEVERRDVMWIPDDTEVLQQRLMACTNMRRAGHRGTVATLQRLQGYCCWFRIESHVKEFVKQCLRCVDSKAGEMVPRSLGETVPGAQPGEETRSFLYFGQKGPLKGDDLDEGGGFKYILVISDDLRNFVWFEPPESCTAVITAKHLPVTMFS